LSSTPPFLVTLNLFQYPSRRSRSVRALDATMPMAAI